MRLFAWWKRGQWETRMDEEFRFHLESRVGDYIRDGLSLSDAERRACQDFGTLELARDECRDAMPLAWLDRFKRSLGLAVRCLRRNPGLALTVILTLALGIGANTAILTVHYATLLAPLPYPQPDQLVMVWSRHEGQSRDRVSAADFTDWKRQSGVFQDLNAWTPDNFIVATEDRRQFLDGMEATPGYCAMLGYPMFLGRGFLPEEGEAGKEHVVILTHRLWQRLGANSEVVGRKIQINGLPYKVVGVLAAGSADRKEEELIVPLAFKLTRQLDRGSRDWAVAGRLKPGVTIKQAQASLDAIAANEARDFPGTNRGWGALVEPFKNDFFPKNRQLTLWVLLGAVGFLLLIACLNVANLLLAQGITRQREVAIRGALGAKPAAIFAQFLLESMVLSMLGCILGMVAGRAMLGGLVAVMPPNALPPEADVRLEVPVLLIMFCVATLSGVAFGCAPAWYASRLNPAGVLKDGGRAGIGVGRHRLLRLLVIAEFALALPMLAGAGLMIHSLWNLTHVDLGIHTDHVLGFYLDSPSIPTKREEINAYYGRILASIGAVPGVTHVAAMEHLPLDSLHYAVPFGVSGRPAEAGSSSHSTADLQTPTPDYFATFGIGIVRGRAFTEYDNEKGPRVAMVNEAFANSFLKGLDPLEQRVTMEQFGTGSAGHAPVEWQIVGVFHTVKSRGAREDFPQIAVPFWQMGADVAGIGVSTGPDPAAMIHSISAAVSAVDPQAALALTRTMDQVHDEALANDRFTLVLFSIFALLALSLTAVGIYGVITFVVGQRSRDIALRMALGSTRNSIVASVVQEGLVLACAGLGLGLIGACFVERAMRSVLFGEGAIDFSVMGAVALTLLSVALLACYLPASRAASVELMEVLRAD
jgi:putative ABC transport system permease protein